MPLQAIVLSPFLFAAAALCARRRKAARVALVVAAAVNLALTARVIHALTLGRCGGLRAGEWLAAERGDGLTLCVLASIAAVFFFTSLYTAAWLGADSATRADAHPQSGGGAAMPEHWFCALMCAFAGAMNLAALSSDAGLMWVAMEATTLISAPLIIQRRNPRTVAALWKYLLICSVGIGFALFGTMLAARAMPSAAHGLGFGLMRAAAEQADPAWFKAAFAFLLAGYGAKMGLAPFHSWLPDAYCAAPPPAAAFMAGTLVNCSFLAIARFYEMAPEAARETCRGMALALAFASLAAAALSMAREGDLGRLLAYSSVEHMGVVMLLAAFSGGAYTAAHLFFHSLFKSALFMLSGAAIAAYGARAAPRVRGMFSHAPFTAALLCAGVLALCALPPSPLFFTEIALVKSAGWALGGAALAALCVVFCAMSRMLLAMTTGGPAEEPPPARAPRALSAVPAAALACAGAAAALCLTRIAGF